MDVKYLCYHSHAVESTVMEKTVDIVQVVTHTIHPVSQVALVHCAYALS